MAPPEKTTYISSTGQLSAPPLTKRIADAVSDMAEIGWLFFDTLFTPFLNPNSTMLDHTGHNDGNAPRPSSNSNSSFFGGGGGGSRLGGSRPPRGGGGGNGGGGGFMSMTDLRGSDTVSACRSACG